MQPGYPPYPPSGAGYSPPDSEYPPPGPGYSPPGAGFQPYFPPQSGTPQWGGPPGPAPNQGASGPPYGPPAYGQPNGQPGFTAPPPGGPGSVPPFHGEGPTAGKEGSPYVGYNPVRPEAAVPPPLPGSQQQPTPQPFQPSGRKRALLVGCNYRGASFQLNGCINDVQCMKHLLKTRFGFTDDCMMILTDDQSNPQRWPTRANVLYQMQMLVWDVRPGDSLFFHYSGHGSQVRDPTGDEADGKNETICPCDFKTAGMIIDDELNRLLVNPLPQGVRLHAVIDACHSGSIMDLEYRAKCKPGQPIHWKQEYAWRPSVYKGTRGGEAIQFGAARDKQTAMDTNQLSGQVSTGAATFSFISAIERVGVHISYGQLLESMAVSIQSVHGGSPSPPAIGGFLGKLVNGYYDMAGLSGQTPCMCCNHPFDFNRPLAV